MAASKKEGDKKVGLTKEEQEAMVERLKEINNKEDGETAVIAKIKEMPEPDKSMAMEIHEIVRKTAPELKPRTWYGMPAYAKNDKIVCFFQSSSKFKSRYSTLGFSDKAMMDEGDMWPVTYAIKSLTAKEKAMITELIKKAVGR
ncbi:hypothetical protein Micr_00959 [Candidatus Micrarchaeum sp.]|jgi:uncharacterized protein YdhG (YjbR/CyaY superfamily)|uniref:iron chaperone n=1 Tax=Candidatus Micrarchaeum sp. TaxID=2282148 RepID=UPI00092B38AE|nr:DUF1801 domain-containing protein [Candidatus Micrarchaeum sp.]OJT93973.1 MAG: hypothetical protein JJ59_05305 [Candidatus Micrarchaeum sp. AZ1]OWP53894.1 MAG: hypothetical protein B2I19_01050 [Thermoplasmatales archaeon ARMAN]QRF74422.1 hypothetical protein Micr_00959 [Candidatus Micrarchaeum sp.]